MAEQKLIAVVGATGAQGGGLARAILRDPDSGFAVRALARDPQSAKARELAGLGAEVVAADLDDPESLRRAFEGAHGAFCVTFFWDHFSPERESKHATALAGAAQHAGVEHVIWSTLEDTRGWVPLDDDRMPTLMGKYKVPHFDAKGESNQVFTERVPTTLLNTSFFWDNLVHFGMGPKRGADGALVFTLPMADKKLPGIAAEDIGGCALGIFRRGPELIGQTVGIAGEHLSGAQMASTLGGVLGEEVRYQAVTPEMYRGFGFPGAEDLGNMFQFKCDFEQDYCAARSIVGSRELYPGLQTFESWLRANKDRISLG